MPQLRSIHYLRAVAAVMVVVFHIFSNVDAMRPDLQSVYWLRGGVDIFFVISGYVMVTSTKNRSISPMQFITHRAQRIIPIYWIATFITMIQIEGLWELKLKSLFFIPAMNPSINRMQPILEPGWTLNYEVFFYVVFAIALFAQRKFLFPIVAAALSVLVLLGFYIDGTEIFEFYSRPIILEFLLGMLIANSSIRLPALCFPAGFILMYFLQPFSLDRVFEFGLPAMLIVAGAVSAEEHIRPSRIFNLLGSASYSIYLFHLLTLEAIIFVYPYFHLGGNKMLFIYISLLFALTSGCLIHLALEKPIITYFISRKNRQSIRTEPNMI